MKKKITLVGSGNIGGTLAHLIALKELGDITLIDVVKGVPQGKALDLAQSSSVELFDVKIEGSNNYSSLKNSDVVIITAGIPRLPGMSRDDLLETNTKIISTIGKAIKQYCPKAFLVCITNPLDAMVSVLQSSSKVKYNMCVGMAGILDSSRMKYFLSKALNVSVKNIETFVLGGHGDTMVPMLRYTKISGIPIQELIKNKMISSKKIKDILNRTQDGGGINENEDPEEAVWREMMEEIGTNKADLIKVSKQWLNYKIPEATLKTLPWGKKYIGQTQKWFAFKFIGKNKDINTGTENPEFSEWQWAKIDSIVDNIVPFKRNVYSKILKEFKELF